MKKILASILFILLLVIVVGVVFKNTKKATPASTKTQKGVSLTPLSFNANDFLDFFSKAKDAGTIITWAGDWHELKNPKSAPFTVIGLSKQYSYTPVIIVSAETSDETGYISSLASLAANYKPEFLGLGNELNFNFRNNPTDLDRFAKIFSNAYDAVKTKSPNTKVFTVFQYETANSLEDAVKFPKADLIAYTTYPEIASISNPDNIPGDYYTKIKDKVTKPVAFTEIGWSGTNPQNQAKFVTKFFELTKNVNALFVIWPFLYDQKAGKPFNNMGLFDSTGTPRQSWEVWKSQK